MRLSLFALFILVNPFAAKASTIEVIPNRGASMSDQAVIKLVQDTVSVNELKTANRIRAQVVSLHKGVVDSLLVYLTFGSEVKSEIIEVDKAAAIRKQLSDFGVTSATEKDLAQTTTVFCPDESVQFISVSQSNLSWDQKSAIVVADSAEKTGLKTVRLLKEQATRQNYLNYLSCPGLVVDFYDGDANSNALETYDGTITAADISIILKNAFHRNVVHVWVACRAFNDPMLSAMVNDAEAQKFVAGQVDLIAGYADRTGVCVMQSALSGKSITNSVSLCHEQQDLHWHNRWGVAGNGSDYLNR
jgi:hypothetical protein